jgi:hypothetical protein
MYITLTTVATINPPTACTTMTVHTMVLYPPKKPCTFMAAASCMYTVMYAINTEGNPICTFRIHKDVRLPFNIFSIYRVDIKKGSYVRVVLSISVVRRLQQVHIVKMENEKKEREGRTKVDTTKTRRTGGTNNGN